VANFQIRPLDEMSGKKYGHRMIRTMRTVLSREAGLSKENIRTILADFKDTVVLIATSDETFAGFAIGFFHNFDDEPEIAAIGDAHIFHLCINIIHPDFQGQGLGMHLIKERIAYAKRHGARTCTSYGRRGASLHNLKKAGGKVIATRENFDGGDETFWIVRIDLA
jgi:GNAT superfamily N-acetyltransferase